MKTSTRRSRFQANPTGRAYLITATDLDVLKLLQGYRYLPSTYVGALLGMNGKYYQDVLAKLRHEARLIDCPNASWSAANARYRPAVYAITEKGENVLKERGVYVPRPKTGSEFNHELMVCLIRASFEIGARKAGLQMIGPDAILSHPACPPARRYEKDPWSVPVSFTYDGASVETAVETDGEFFGLALPKGEKRTTLVFPGFEADRRTEPLEPESYDRPSIKKKFLAFREIARQGIYKSRYGLPRDHPLHYHQRLPHEEYDAGRREDHQRPRLEAFHFQKYLQLRGV